MRRLRWTWGSVYRVWLRCEGGGGQAGGVVQVAGDDAHPTVANVHRVRNVAGRHDNRVVFYARVAGLEDVVGAGELESARWVVVKRESGGVVEPDSHVGGTVRLEFGGGFAEKRALILHLFAVDDVARGECEAGAYGLLIGWVDVVGEADVDGDRHCRIGEAEDAALCIADHTPVFSGRVEAGDLNVEKGKIALPEMTAPVLYQAAKERGVIGGAIGRGVGFALVPEEALDGHRGEGGDHSVVEGSRLV